MADNVSQHFRPSEAAFIDVAQGLIRQALDEYRPVLTNFLNPRQRYILETLVNQHDELKIAHSGGYTDAESARSLIAPDYYDVQQDDFEIAAIRINYPTKFAELHHSTVLGTLINNGLYRDSFGDIISSEEGDWQIVATEQMARFITSSLDHVGKTKVRFEPMTLADIVTPQEEWDDINTTVSSLRLDTIVANGYNVSRTHAKELVERGMVRVNWTEIDRPDFMLAVNDLISVRRFGRMKLLAENGITKKDKWRVTLAVIKK